MTDLLTTKQVQALLRVDRTTIYRMVESGQLPAIRVGKQWRFAQNDVDRWLHAARSTPVQPAAAEGSPPPGAPAADNAPGPDLRALLPLSCAQMIQDTFAEILGVMVLITDMQGQPITRISNPCGFFANLVGKNPRAVEQCVGTWQQLAGDPALAPKFSTSELDLLCARGVIRAGAELKGMVVLGGIAPENWPPSSERLAALAQAFNLQPDDLRADLDAVYRLNRPAQARVLGYVQRIADIFSHIIEDRGRAPVSQGRGKESDTGN